MEDLRERPPDGRGDPDPVCRASSPLAVLPAEELHELLRLGVVVHHGDARLAEGGEDGGGEGGGGHVGGGRARRVKVQGRGHILHS